MLRTVYRLLLRLLPGDWDATDRAEMLDHFDERVRHARADSGRSGAVGVRIREISDVARSVVRVRPWSGYADCLVQDVRIGVRGLRRTPLVTLMAVASLALGIGATTAVFSALDVWVIRPLPVHEPDRLVDVGLANRAEGRERSPFSPGEFLDWREASRSTELAAWRPITANLTLGDRAERVEVVEVSANFLDVLGVDPRVGRGFRAEEERTGAPRVALLSDAAWRNGLGADAEALGRSVILNGEPRTIVGVLPPSARFASFRNEVWVPFRFSDEPSRATRTLRAVGRVGPGTSLEAAREELQAVAARVAEADPERAFPDAAVQPFRDALYGDLFKQAGAVLAASVLFLLLIACANVTHLLLARGAARRREIAVRASLGANRGRIIRQLLTESLVLATLGGLVGVGVAWLGVEALVTHVLPEIVPGWSEISLDRRVLSVAAIATLVSVVLSGLAPALRGSRVGLTHQLADGRRSSRGRPGRRLSDALVTGQIALALALLTSAALLIGSLARLQRVDIGFRTEDAVWFGLYVPPASEPDADGVQRFHQRVLEELEAIPGAGRATAVGGAPIGRWSTRLYTPAESDGSRRTRRSAEYRGVAADYADVMGMRILAGRWFSDRIDVHSAPPTAVVSRVLAEAEWGSVSEAPGRRLVLGDGEEVRVVGVVEAGRMHGPQLPPPPVIFRPLAQRRQRGVFYVLEAARDPGAVIRAVREVVHSIDPTVAVHRGEPLEAVLSEQLVPEHMTLRLLAPMGVVALLLTLVGVYGVVAHTVGQRRHELGLRLALGAAPGRLIATVLGRSGRTALSGLAAGAALSLAIGRVLATALEGVKSHDPAVLLAVAGVLLTAILLAAFLAARRAARMDPVECFREG